MRATLVGRFGKLIFAVLVLFLVLFARVLADDGIDAVLTNVNQLATVFSNPPGDFPLVLPLETAPTNGFSQWWVHTADPLWRTDRWIPIWWTDFGQLPTNFTVLRDYQSTTNASGIQVWPLKLIRYEDTGAVSVQVPANSTELLSFSPPPNYQPDSLYERVLREWLALGTFSNWQSYDDLVAQYPDLSPPRLILPLWIADINDMPACETNEDASQAGMFSTSEDDEIQFDSVSSSCNITNLTQPFFITAIGRGTNGCAITWQSCPIFRYIVFSTDQLSTNTAWLTRAYVWGQVNASTSSWTDATTTNAAVTQRFYRVQRILASSIGAGFLHSLALTPDGKLWAWGNNENGQLGDGLDISVEPHLPYPGEVAAVVSCVGQFINNPVTAGGGEDFTVMADANGTVWTDGFSDPNELGNGVNDSSTKTPTPISGVTHIVSVAIGTSHTLALRSDGAVFTWGNDIYGQLGVGNQDPIGTNSPTQIGVLTQIVAIAAGSFHSVALDANGTVWTWGDATFGQLGNGLYGQDVSTNVPIMLTSISNVIAIAAGDGHTIALTTNKTVWTWGDNFYGQLGRNTGTPTYDPLPGQVTGLSNVVAIAGGNTFTLAVTSNGQVYAWGDNGDGQLGTTNGVGSTNRPMAVAGISNAVLVSAPPGGYHILAVTVDQGTNRYWAWGYNGYGQVGNGTTTDQFSPSQVQFCTRCQRNIQLGSAGSFTAQCNGTLKLYFNTDNFGACTGAYNVTFGSLVTNVPANASTGVVVGSVTNGGVYSFSASGFCTWNTSLGRQADPDGIDPGSNQVACSSLNLNVTNSICPAAKCFSLVGKIQ